MNHHVLLINQAHLDSPEIARRREHLLLLDRETRDSRRHGRREWIRRGWNVLIPKRTDRWMRRAEAPDLRQALR